MSASDHKDQLLWELFSHHKQLEKQTDTQNNHFQILGNKQN